MADFKDIAEHYDRMTGLKKRLVNDFGIIKNITEKYNSRVVLDAGCGTGVHTIILSKLGLDVIGLDSSAEMLEHARTNALREGSDPEFVHEYIESMPNQWTDKFDTVFCLANSLVGVETGERLSLSFKSFNRVLQPGGRAIIQVLNFIKFRREERRIIKVSTVDNFTYVRFFDFEEKVTRLNVLIIKHDMGEVRHKLISEKILPMNEEVLAVAAKMGRFKKLEFFSDLSLSEPSTLSSDNLVMVATK